MKKNNFTRRIIWTLVLGLGVGLGFIFLRETLIGNGNASLWKQINDLLFADILQPANTTAIGIFYIIGQIFMRLLQLVLVPLIFTSIVRSIQQIQETRVLNKLAKKGFGNFMQLLAIAIVLASVTGFTAYKLGVFQIANLGAIGITEGVVNQTNPLSMLLNAFNNNALGTLSSNSNIIAVVVLALIVGVMAQQLGEKMEVLPKLIDEIYLLSMKLLDVVITKFGPIAIFCLLVRTLASYGTDYLQPALIYMILTSLTLLVLGFVLFPLFIAIKTGLSPIPFIKKMYKVAVFGFSTSSSAATLPLTQETVMNELGVDEAVASFIVPLASTINMTGTAVMQIIATLFVASVAGYHVGIVELVSIILLTIIGSISTPAAPGSGAILLFTILTGMGYTNQYALAAYSFILAINRPVEMLVTAINVVDDGVSAVCVAHDLEELNLKTYHESPQSLQNEEPVYVES